jgi:predicted aspartyl protease
VILSSVWTSALAAGIALGLALPAKTEVRPRGPVTPLEVDENGQLIVKVRLSSKKPGAPDRDFRFIFDTGATMCVIDPTVPSDFFWEEPEKPKGDGDSVKDGTGKSVAARATCLKHLELTGMVREDLLTYRMDLKNTMLGRIEDEPVDGILGMNFLRGTRFVLDPMAREIRWWQDIPGQRIPMAYLSTGNPAITIRIAGTEVPFLLDTGANGGIQLPGSADESDHPKPFFYASASGELLVGKTVEVDRLESGGKAWLKVPLDLVKSGEGSAMIGQAVLGAAPIGLDFLDQWITFTLDARGNLPYQKTPGRPPLIWERGSSGNRLLVWRVNPVSRWAKGGLKEGDDVLAIGPLTDKTLNLRSATALANQGQAHTWRIRRNGTERLLDVPAEK